MTFGPPRIVMASCTVFLCLMLGRSSVLATQTIQPQPFPGSTGSGSAARPSAPTGGMPASTAGPRPAQVPPPAPREAAPTNDVLRDAPVFPSAQFIGSYDAGHNQRYYLYGTDASYADVLNFYKKQLRDGGRELYKVPAMQQFELGKYDDSTMAYPPSVMVEDYVGDGSKGYLFVSGTSEKRFRTVIQIVPNAAPSR